MQFKSDELTYDSTNKITEATGNVEAVQRGRRLLADRIIYDELQDKVTAIGNVTLYEPTGEVITAKSMELTGDLKNGVVEDLRAVLADGARLSAASGERKDGIITTAHDATYTAVLSVRRRSVAGAAVAAARRQGQGEPRGEDHRVQPCLARVSAASRLPTIPYSISQTRR